MLDQLNMPQSKLYTRAVEPTAESRLRVRENPSITPATSDDVQGPASRAQVDRQQLSRYQDIVQGQSQGEQRARDVAEQLSEALRQSKQQPARYRAPFSLTTNTGRQANQSYLNGGQASEARFVDEIA
jgi:hypothetical protein